MTWLLVIKLFVGDTDTPTTVLQREFPTEALCRAERDHLAAQALPAGTTGRIVLSCEPRA